MEEEDELALLNYKTPKGKLIKLLEQKTKKPEIDDSLKKILDEYNEITRKETPFLDNGVFQHLNFAEDALMIQACGQYYGKRVDKLWDELLQLHTRLVKYDEVTAKNCTDSKKQQERKQELARLEERLNRGKRKKVVLSQPDAELPPTNGQRLTEARIDGDERVELFSKVTWERQQRIGAARDKEEIDWGSAFEFEEVYEVPRVPFEADEVYNGWNKIYQDKLQELERNYNSVILIQYHKLRNRFKHHLRLNMEDEVYDMDDPEEFNSRIGRLISYQHIINNFEDNDRCLLPDDNMTLAKLRLAVYGRKNWMLKNNISMYTPYEDYREPWLKFRKEFFERERRKIQNMPQNSCKETILFFRALAKKEQIARQKIAELKAQGYPDRELPSINFYDIIIMPAKDGYKGPLDPFIPEGFDLPGPPPIDLTDPEKDVSQELPQVPAVEGDKADYEPEVSTVLENEPDHSGESPAVEGGHEAVVSTLLENGPDHPVESPAVEGGHEGVVSTLLENGPDHPGESPAVEGGLEAVVSTLLENQPENPEKSPAVEGDQGDHEPEISTLLENVAEHPDPNAQASDTLRSDSGYFDGGFEDDESHSPANNDQCDTPFEFDKEHAGNIGESALKSPTDSTEAGNPTDKESASTENQSELNNNLSELNSSFDLAKNPNSISEDATNSLPDYDREKMNAQIKEFAQQSLIEPEAIYNALEDSYFHQDGEVITIVYNKPDVREEDDVEGDFIKMFGNDVTYETFYPEKCSRKRKLEISEMEHRCEARRRLLLSCEKLEPLQKIRKLSSKQVERLKLSLVGAVRELKWEHFYSMNYQTENGEGEVTRIDYESDEDDTNEDTQFDNENTQAESSDPTDVNVSGYHSDHDPCSRNNSPSPVAQESGINMDITFEETHVVNCQPEKTTHLSQLKEYADILPKIIRQGDSEPQTAEDLEAAAILERLADPAQAEEVIREREEILKKQREEEWEKMGPDEREIELVRERVAEWKERMTQKLKNVKEQDFDIHEYGTTIMESLTNEQPKPFNEFIEGKSSSEVVRFFVSSLQLANTMNVELCGAKQGELSNDTLSLRLLNKERYHDHLQEYQAPSEENLRERLQRVRADMNNRVHEENLSSRQPAMIEEDNGEYRPRATYKRQKTKTRPLTERTNNTSEFLRPKQHKRPIAQIIQEDSDDDEDCQPLQVYKDKLAASATDQTHADFQQPSTSRQADMKDLEILSHQCLKRKSSTTKGKKTSVISPVASSTPWSRPSPDKIRILNFDMGPPRPQELNVMRSPEFEWPQQLPSSSYVEHNVVEMALSEIAQTPTRSSIDSGFVPSCDEDFLEQFDHFQQTNDGTLHSTPVKPRNEIRINLLNMNLGNQ